MELVLMIFGFICLGWDTSVSLNLPTAKGPGGSKGESIGVSGLSSCDYSIPAMTDGKPSFANNPL